MNGPAITVVVGENEHGAWVECEECDFSDRMLTRKGAEDIANDHVWEHIAVVVEYEATDQARERVKALGLDLTDEQEERIVAILTEPARM